jgi:hypothetical protein
MKNMRFKIYDREKSTDKNQRTDGLETGTLIVVR